MRTIIMRTLCFKFKKYDCVELCHGAKGRVIIHFYILMSLIYYFTLTFVVYNLHVTSDDFMY